MSTNPPEKHAVKKAAAGYLSVALGLMLAAVGLHVSSDPPDAQAHQRKGRAESALGTVGSLGGGAAFCYVGYRLLTSNAARRESEDSPTDGTPTSGSTSKSLDEA